MVTSMLPAIFLSGFIFPIRSMPLALQVITYAVPARYFIVILRGVILKGAGLGALRGATSASWCSTRALVDWRSPTPGSPGGRSDACTSSRG